MEEYPQPEAESPEQSEEDEDDPRQAVKVFMPAEYNKAKRNITKLVNSYFTALKEQVKQGAKLTLDRSKLEDI